MTERDVSELLTLAPHMRGRMCYILIQGLRDPDFIVRRKEIPVSVDRLLIKMGKMGLLISIKPGVWKVNIEYLRKVAYVVNDEMFDQISDPEVMFEYRKKKKGRYGNITYEEQRRKRMERDRGYKKVRRENRERIAKEKKTEIKQVSQVLFIGGEDDENSPL